LREVSLRGALPVHGQLAAKLLLHFGHRKDDKAE
jgi:hypothetical protein